VNAPAKAALAIRMGLKTHVRVQLPRTQIKTLKGWTASSEIECVGNCTRIMSLQPA